MVNLEIPVWNEIGLIPPMDLKNPTSAYRSPYKTDLVNIVERYATSPQRINILRGFIRFRCELHKTGLVDGFQWIDGSFIEEIETSEKRPPNDLDVVTFFRLSENDTQFNVIGRNPDLFAPDTAEWRKNEFKVDSYLQPLQIGNDKLVERTVYWYSMWSHRRDLVWKGFLQIPLSPDQDSHAVAALNALEAMGGEQ